MHAEHCVKTRSLSGVNLPRGETIETRVPLFMRLMADSSLSSSFAEIATSPDMRESYVRLDDLGAISPEIRRLTVLLAGPGGHVKNTPIYLNVTHPRGPTMTVIDLPGITHIAAEEGVVRRRRWSHQQAPHRQPRRPTTSTLNSKSHGVPPLSWPPAALAPHFLTGAAERHDG